MEQRTIRVDGLRVRVVEASPRAERDDPVLMIHGLGGWAENWRELMPAIAASGRRAIAVDLPGFGASERPRRSRYFDPDEPSYARFVAAALDTLGVPQAHIAGHSLGGAVAYTAAVTLLARLRRSPAVTRQVLYSCFHDPARCPEEVVAEALRYGAPAAPEMVRALRSAVSFRHGIRDDVRLPWIARAPRHRGPTLVVWGIEDRVIPASAVEEARRITPEAEVVLIPSCGHLVMIERPGEMLDAFLPFLDRAAVAVAP